MTLAPHHKKYLGFGLLTGVVLFLGFIAGSLVFSDFGPGESLAQRVVVIVAYHFLLGLAVGAISPKTWWLAGFLGWLDVVFAVAALFQGEGSFLTALGSALLLASPVLVSLVAGWLGRDLPNQLRKSSS